MSKAIFKVTCDKPILFSSVQFYFNKLGFNWKGVWRDNLMNFSNGTQWLFLHDDKSFGWSTREDCGVPDYDEKAFNKYFEER